MISVSQIVRHPVQGSKITGFQDPGSRPGGLQEPKSRSGTPSSLELLRHPSSFFELPRALPRALPGFPELPRARPSSPELPRAPPSFETPKSRRAPSAWWEKACGKDQASRPGSQDPRFQNSRIPGSPGPLDPWDSKSRHIGFWTPALSDLGLDGGLFERPK